MRCLRVSIFLLKGDYMRILSAIYLEKDGVEKEIHPREITARNYENKLKGKLYCPTENCPARISFSRGKTVHFRTWRFDEHLRNCLYYFDRIPMSLGRNTTNTISVDITYDRRQNALQDAFVKMNLSEEEKEILQKNRAASGARKRERAVTITKRNATSFQMVLFDGDLYEDELLHRRRNISKRFVDEIAISDIGEIRLIMGKVKNSKKEGEVAEIVIENNKETITVVFEEAFVAEPLNRSYLNKFWAIERLLDQLGQVQFTGIGDVRENVRLNRLELAIYTGTDFRINNLDMFVLAGRYTRADLEEGYLLRVSN